MSAFTINTNAEGNLVDDLTLRYTTSGRAVANGRIAVTKRSRNPQGQELEHTEFLNLVLWNGMAENAAESVRKGDRVMVSGQLQQRSYTDRDGNTRYTTELVADGFGVSLRWHIVNDMSKAGKRVPAGVTPADTDDTDAVIYGEEEPF